MPARTYADRMRKPVTYEAFEDAMVRAATGATGHQQVAAQMLAWAEHPQDRDEVSAADLFVGAGEQFALAEDHSRALESYRAATMCDTRAPARAVVSRQGEGAVVDLF